MDEHRRQQTNSQIALTLCPSACRYCIDPVRMRHGGYPRCIPYRREFQVSPKITTLRPELCLKLTSDLEKNLPRHDDHRKCCQLNSTNDSRQLITVGVRLRAQHCGSNIARRAGSSATAEICRTTRNHDLIELCGC